MEIMFRKASHPGNSPIKTSVHVLGSFPLFWSVSLLVHVQSHVTLVPLLPHIRYLKKNC